MELKKLSEPFPAEDIEWRVSRAGKNNNGPWAFVLAYVTNRAIMERLDEVCGPENWKNEYVEGPGGGVLCGLSIRVGDEWVTKYDGAENTNIDAVKGGLSGAMKRAGVQWGIGRYLYNLTENFAQTTTERQKHPWKYQGKGKNNEPFYWLPPTLPDWALPKQPEQKQDHQWQGNQKAKYVSLLQSVGMDLDNGKDLIEFYLSNTGQTKMTQEQVVYLVDNFNHVVGEFKAYLDNA